MREEIEKHLKERESLATQFKKWCKDKSIPLEDRWKLFIESEMGEADIYTPSFQTIDLDRFSFNREELVEIDGFIESVGDEFFDDILSEKFPEATYPLPDDIQEQMETLTDIEIDKFKEEVLSKFIKSFTWDW